MQHRQAPQRNQRHEVARADPEPALPPVERHVEGEKEQRDDANRCRHECLSRTEPVEESHQRQDQHRCEEEKAAVRRNGDAIQRLQRRTLHDAEGGVGVDEARVHRGDRRAKETAATDLLIDRQDDQWRCSSGEEANAPWAGEAEQQQCRSAEVIHCRGDAGRRPRPRAAAHRQRDEHQPAARRRGNEQCRVWKELSRQSDCQCDGSRPRRGDALFARIPVKDQRNDCAEQRDANDRADVDVQREHEWIVRIVLEWIKQRVWNGAEKRKAGRLVRVDVPVVLGDIAGV